MLSQPVAVGGEYIRETKTLERGGLRLRILMPVDCVRDRLSHFYFWNDYQALAAAVAVASEHCEESDLLELQNWTERQGPGYRSKFDEFRRRQHAERTR